MSLVEEWISLESNSSRVKIHYSASEISPGSLDIHSKRSDHWRHYPRSESKVNRVIFFREYCRSKESELSAPLSVEPTKCIKTPTRHARVHCVSLGTLDYKICQIKRVTVRSSECSWFRRFVIPKVCYFEGPLFRRFILKVHYSEGSLIRIMKKVTLFWRFVLSKVHSKNSRVKLDPERVHWGQTPFPVKDDPEIGQLSADLTNNWVRLTQLWVIFRPRLTDFRVIVDPEWSLASMDPFPVKFDAGVLECPLFRRFVNPKYEKGFVILKVR